MTTCTTSVTSWMKRKGDIRQSAEMRNQDVGTDGYEESGEEEGVETRPLAWA